MPDPSFFERRCSHGFSLYLQFTHSVIKEVCGCHDGNFIHVLRTGSYDNRVFFIAHLNAVCEKDCKAVGAIPIGDPEVKHYAGECYKHTYGVEFRLDRKLDGYTEIHQLEYTL